LYILFRRIPVFKGLKSQNISVTIVTKLRNRGFWGSIPGKSSDFIFLRSVQTDFGVHPTSYKMYIGDWFLAVK
jgi:hypothetical protein